MTLLAVRYLLCLPPSFGYLFDFGLMENEQLVMELAREEQQLLSGLATVQQHQSQTALTSLLTHADSWDNTSAAEFVLYPVNVFHLIKRNLENKVRAKALIENRNLSQEVINKVSSLYEQSELLKQLKDEDLQQSINALAIMIHSYNIDVEEFSRGVVCANSEGKTLQVLIEFSSYFVINFTVLVLLYFTDNIAQP